MSPDAIHYLFNQLDKKDVYETNSLFDHIVVFSYLLDPFSFKNTYSAVTLKDYLLDVTCNYHTCRCLLISSPQRELSFANQPTFTQSPKKHLHVHIFHPLDSTFGVCENCQFTKVTITLNTRTK